MFTIAAIVLLVIAVVASQLVPDYTWEWKQKRRELERSENQ
jgi:hypothetical protein